MSSLPSFFHFFHSIRSSFLPSFMQPSSWTTFHFHSFFFFLLDFSHCVLLLSCLPYVVFFFPPFISLLTFSLDSLFRLHDDLRLFVPFCYFFSFLFLNPLVFSIFSSFLQFIALLAILILYIYFILFSSSLLLFLLSLHLLLFLLLLFLLNTIGCLVFLPITKL